MPRTFGDGVYSAYRENGILHVTASGFKPTLQTKVTLEELPFLIYPPRLALLFETDGITSPVVLPFEIERSFPHYPASTKVVSIEDRHGLHAINIVEKQQTLSNLKITDPEAADFVVYQQIGADRFLIAKSDAIVLAIYFKVFGPDTYAHCQAYVAEHSLIIPSIEVIRGSLKAWIDKQPPNTSGKFVVTVDAFVEVDWTISLVTATPQGINPLVKLLKIDIRLPPGPIHSHAIVSKTLRYEEVPPQDQYTDVTVEDGAHAQSTKVEITS